MLDTETHERIRRRHERGETIRGIARAERLSRNTVRRALGKTSLVRTGHRKGSKLDPFRARITYLVLEENLSGVRVLEEIRQLGYQGGKSILNEYIARLRPKGSARPTIRLEPSEGEEGQMDWSEYRLGVGGQHIVVYAFCYVLGYSRQRFVRFATDQTLPTIIRLHEECFRQLQGTARTNTYDNMTTVGRHVGPGQVWLNPRFEAFAHHYGFRIRILPPGRPQLHGKVENAFRYVEKNFLAGRRFDDLDHLNRKAQWWCDTVANVRVHGTLRERPLDRYHRELPFLVPVPGQAFEQAQVITRKVNPHFCVVLDTNQYSVHPKHVGREATIKVADEQLKVFIDHELVAVHPLLTERYARHILPEHEEAFKDHSHQRELLEAAFLKLGPAAEEFYQGLLAERGRGAGFHLSRIVQLAKRQGAAVVAGALRHAGRYGAFSAEAVARIVQGNMLPSPRTTRPRGDAATLLPPEQVRTWLEGLDVEVRDLADYDKLLADGTDEEV
jgi:transposase